MDKSWMTMGKTPDNRLSHPYIEGVYAFINFARPVVDLSGNILCPCIHCAIPLTQEKISNLVLKKKSSIVKGLSM